MCPFSVSAASSGQLAARDGSAVRLFSRSTGPSGVPGPHLSSFLDPSAAAGVGSGAATAASSVGGPGVCGPSCGPGWRQSSACPSAAADGSEAARRSADVWIQSAGASLEMPADDVASGVGMTDGGTLVARRSGGLSATAGSSWKVSKPAEPSERHLSGEGSPGETLAIEGCAESEPRLATCPPAEAGGDGVSRGADVTLAAAGSPRETPCSPAAAGGVGVSRGVDVTVAADGSPRGTPATEGSGETLATECRDVPDLCLLSPVCVAAADGGVVDVTLTTDLSTEFSGGSESRPPACPPAAAGVVVGATSVIEGSAESKPRLFECPPAAAGGVADGAVVTDFCHLSESDLLSPVHTSAVAGGAARGARHGSWATSGSEGKRLAPARLYGGMSRGSTLRTSGVCVNKSVRPRPRETTGVSAVTSAGLLRMSPPGMSGAAICAALNSGGCSGPRVSGTRIAGDRGPEVFVSGGVGERKVEWLLDTGAQCTVIDASVIEGLELPRIPAPQRPVAVEGTPLDLNCVVVCDLSVGARTLRDHPVYVMNDLKPYCILGTDVLKRLGSSVWIDFESNSVHIRRCAVPDDSSSVTLSASVSIPPKHEAVVMCQVPSSIHPREIVVENADKLSDEYSVVSARTVAAITESHLIPLKLMNPTNRTVGIPAKTTVGRIVEEPLLKEPVPRQYTAKDSSSWAEELISASDVQDAAQQGAMSDLLVRYSDTFSTDGKLGKCDIVKHTIPLKEDAHPICQPPRRLGMVEREAVEREVERMEQDGIIRASSSPWSSRVVPVWKADGSLRLCVDYRRLNDVTHGDSHPLPRVDDSLDALSGAVWFHTLDLRSGYWQQEMDENDKSKTAFATQSGLYEFQRMPFGLKGAPASFQRLMMAVLAGLTWRECLVYLDDIIVYGRTFDEALERLEHVLKALKDANLKLHPHKCRLFRHQVKFLGHIVSDRGISADPDKVAAVRDYQRPNSVHEVRKFVGFASYFRRFMPQFSSVAKPLLKLTEDRAKFVWDEACESAFQTLKELLCRAPVLAFPDFNESFILTTDASSVGLGAVLSQRAHDGSERPVAYASRCLTKAEINYTTTERECLAVVWAVRHFAAYLQGRQFKLVTDHCPLTFLRSCKDPRGRLARWIIELEQFTYVMEYRKGNSIPHADALSRGVTAPLREILISSDEGDKVKAQRSDPDLLQVIACLVHGQPCPPDAMPTTKFYLSHRESLKVDPASNLLFWVADGEKRLVVPASSVREVLAACHDSQFSGHLGLAKTTQKVKERFFWRSMHDDIVTYIRSCERCCQKKSPPTPKRANFGEMPVPSAPWQWIGMDIAGPFPTTDRDSRYILVVTCAFSKWVETFAIPNQEASTIASVLVDQLFSRYGCPSVIHTDQGRNFEANLMKDIFNHLGIKKTRTSGYHPQGNGLVERFNKTVCSMLSMFVADDQRDWDLFLPKVTFAYNTSVHESTKEMPFTLFMGRMPRLPADVACGAESCPASLLLSEERKKDMYQKVSAAITAAAARRAERQARRANVETYQVGDFIWLHNPARKVGRSPKLHRPWEGPYQVTAVLSDSTYRIQLSKAGSRRRGIVVHHDRLKPCFCREEERYNGIRNNGQERTDSVRDTGVLLHDSSSERAKKGAHRHRLAESQDSLSDSDSWGDLALVWDQSNKVRNDVETESGGIQGNLGAQDQTTSDLARDAGIDGGLRRGTRDRHPVQRHGEWVYDVGTDVTQEPGIDNIQDVVQMREPPRDTQNVPRAQDQRAGNPASDTESHDEANLGADLRDTQDDHRSQDPTISDLTPDAVADGGLRRSTRNRQPVQRYGEWEYNV